MANEITASINIQLNNAGLIRDEMQPGKIVVDQATAKKWEATPTVGTTESSAAIVGITTPGLCYIRCLHATNTCEVGTTTGDYPIKLDGQGLPAIIPLNATKTTLYLKASGASTDVEIKVWAK